MRIGSRQVMFAHNCPVSTVEAVLDGGANPAGQNRRNMDTPLHTACRNGRLDVAKLLVERYGAESECLTKIDMTPLDCLRDVPAQEASDPIRIHIIQCIIQCYAQVLAQRDGLLCVHSVLQETFIDGDDEEFELPVGKLNTEHLQKLLERIIAAEPGSVRALDSDGLLPLQVASQLNFPDLVINVLLRPYPDALL